jgi:hypothetical protein
MAVDIDFGSHANSAGVLRLDTGVLQESRTRAAPIARTLRPYLRAARRWSCGGTRLRGEVEKSWYACVASAMCALCELTLHPRVPCPYTYGSRGSCGGVSVREE